MKGYPQIGYAFMFDENGETTLRQDQEQEAVNENVRPKNRLTTPTCDKEIT